MSQKIDFIPCRWAHRQHRPRPCSPQTQRIQSSAKTGLEYYFLYCTSVLSLALTCLSSTSVGRPNLLKNFSRSLSLAPEGMLPVIGQLLECCPVIGQLIFSYRYTLDIHDCSFSLFITFDSEIDKIFWMNCFCWLLLSMLENRDK